MRVARFGVNEWFWRPVMHKMAGGDVWVIKHRWTLRDLLDAHVLLDAKDATARYDRDQWDEERRKMASQSPRRRR